MVSIIRHLSFIQRLQEVYVYTLGINVIGSAEVQNTLFVFCRNSRLYALTVLVRPKFTMMMQIY